MKILLHALTVIAAIAAAATAFAAPPASVEAAYQVFRDGLHVATVDERFKRTADGYEIVSATDPAGVLKRLFRTQVRAQSAGTITASGLRPQRFEYGRLDDATKNVKAAFDWNTQQLRMFHDGREETASLQHGTQDRLSLMYQFMFLSLQKADAIVLPMTNGRKIEAYRYRIAGRQLLDTPIGQLKTLHLVREQQPGDNSVEVWLALERGQVPVKVSIVESDGARFEQVISRLEVR